MMFLLIPPACPGSSQAYQLSVTTLVSSAHTKILFKKKDEKVLPYQLHNINE